MPVEHLWKWLREDVTNHTCYHNKTQLINQVACFELAVNSSPLIELRSPMGKKPS